MNVSSGKITRSHPTIKMVGFPARSRKKHGDFTQDAASHLTGRGCSKCHHDNLHCKFSFTTDQFIEKAKLKHGNKYDYSKVVYTRSQDKIIIICPVHGEFNQVANSHLQGMGCQLCANHEINRNLAITIPEFIEIASKLHSNKYDYSKVCGDINYEAKILIICPKHGVFNQRVGAHIRGRGCSKCRASFGELKIREWLIEHNIKFEEQKKFIGCMNKRHLFFDFYIPSMNMVIEFDGAQHFEEVNIKRYKVKFKDIDKVKIRDNIKNKWCLENNISLIRIKYDENINIRLSEVLDKQKSS